MRMRLWLSAVVVTGSAFLAGCQNEASSVVPAEAPQAAEKAAVPGEPIASTEVEGSEGDHSGWWCPEHGVPEEICSMCSSKVAAEFQKNGDWCEKHDRADSQCFICHPELAAKFAAQYVAKYGKQPPAREE